MVSCARSHADKLGMRAQMGGVVSHASGRASCASAPRAPSASVGASMQGKGEPWPMIEVRCAVKTSFGRGF
eukprot:6960144-Prymnesium_polylepis.1